MKILSDQLIELMEFWGAEGRLYATIHNPERPEVVSKTADYRLMADRVARCLPYRDYENLHDAFVECALSVWGRLNRE